MLRQGLASNQPQICQFLLTCFSDSRRQHVLHNCVIYFHPYGFRLEIRRSHETGSFQFGTSNWCKLLNHKFLSQSVLFCSSTCASLISSSPSGLQLRRQMREGRDKAGARTSDAHGAKIKFLSFVYAADALTLLTLSFCSGAISSHCR